MPAEDARNPDRETMPAPNPSNTASDQDGPLLITGASGFVGEHFVRHFLGQGWRTAGTFLSNQPEIARAELFPFDITDELAWRRLLRDMRPRAIVHCAAKTRVNWCEDNPEEARATNVAGTYALCEAVASLAPHTPVVYLSTDLVFDGERAPYGEEDEAKPLSTYASLKCEAEGPVLDLPRGIVLRTALVYGFPTSRGESFLNWLVESLSGGRPVPLFVDEWRTPVFVEDLAAAVQLLLTCEPEETSQTVFHAGGAERVSRMRMGEMVCEVFDFPRERLVRGTREQAPPPPRPRDVSLRSARLLALGWTPLSFRDGLLQCRDRWNSLKPRSAE